MTDAPPPTWDDFRAAVRANIERELAREAADAEARRAQTLPKLRRALADARSRDEVGRAWLFGSFAWGQPSDRSDIDLLVENCPEIFHLAASLAEVCDRDVHVIPVESAPETLVRRAQLDGVAL